MNRKYHLKNQFKVRIYNATQNYMEDKKTFYKIRDQVASQVQSHIDDQILSKIDNYIWSINK